MKPILRNRASVTLGVMLGGIAMLSPSAAFAQSTNNITGTWTAKANTSNMTLKITQASSGSISGTIQDLTFGQQPQPIRGFYSPVARRLVFLRSFNGTPIQAYEASLSQDGISLGGSFKTLNASGGASSNGIDFNFSASKSQ